MTDTPTVPAAAREALEAFAASSFEVRSAFDGRLFMADSPLVRFLSLGTEALVAETYEAIRAAVLEEAAEEAPRPSFSAYPPKETLQ